MAERTFGQDAKTTLKSWGILRSEDLGLIIDGLVRKQFLNKQEGDTWRDFEAAFDMDGLLNEDDGAVRGHGESHSIAAEALR